MACFIILAIMALETVPKYRELVDNINRAYSESSDVMVKVKVSQGWLEGERLQTITGDATYCSFKGIPYAQPPLGKLRFKAPQPPLQWDGIRKATEHGPICPQMDIITQKIKPGNEDCLYLNVYTADINPQNPLPVMFFIHGGGFMSGSGNVDIYGPDFLVAQGVVVVTINYRLEVLGFLCLDTKDVPGNTGMKDQVAALKWVKDNIGNFGGDPNNVTIFGESAGGASVAFHVISPMSKGLFRRAISMSGVPFCDWVIPYQPRKRAFVLGKQLGIDTEDPNELLEYLQSIPVDKLIDTKPFVLKSEEIANNVLRMYHFTPVIEKEFGNERFLIEEPIESLKNGRINDVDVFIGYTNEESLFGIPYFENSLLKVYDRYPEMFVPREIILKSTPDVILNIAEKVRNHFFGKKAIGVDMMKEFITFSSETSFINAIHRYVNRLPKIGNSKRYFYKFSCVSDRNIYGKQGAKYGIHKAAHLDDLMYLFDVKSLSLKVDKNSNEYKLVQLVCTVFTNFAKYGTPTPDTSLGEIWPEYEKISKSYVEIADNLTIRSSADIEAMLKFWKSIYEYAGIEF